MKIPILSYHSIGNDYCPLSLNVLEFEKHLIYLKKNNYNSIFFDEINNSNKKPFIITFDDGYKDLIKNCLPIMKKYNFKATCYIVSGLIGKTNLWDENDKKIKSKKLMDISDIECWIESGMRIGSHSKNHKKLTTVNDNVLFEEIVNSKKDLQNLTGTQVESFCYPYGKYNENVINKVKKNYSFAFTTQPSTYNTIKHNKYLLPRIDMGKKISNFKLFLKLKTPYEDLKNYAK